MIDTDDAFDLMAILFFSFSILDAVVCFVFKTQHVVVKLVKLFVMLLLHLKWQCEIMFLRHIHQQHQYMSSNCSIFSLIDFAFLSSVYWVNMSYKRNYWCSCHFFVALIHHQLVSFKQNILHHSPSDYHNPPFWRCYLQIEMFPSDQTCHSLLTGISTICVKLISCHHSLYCTCFNLSLINIFFIKSLIFLTFVLL